MLGKAQTSHSNNDERQRATETVRRIRKGRQGQTRTTDKAEQTRKSCESSTLHTRAPAHRGQETPRRPRRSTQRTTEIAYVATTAGAKAHGRTRSAVPALRDGDGVRTGCVGDARALKRQGRQSSRSSTDHKYYTQVGKAAGGETKPSVVTTEAVSSKITRKRTIPKPLKSVSGTSTSSDQHLRADKVTTRGKRRKTIGQKNYEMAREIAKRGKKSLPVHSDTEDVDGGELRAPCCHTSYKACGCWRCR